jgi:hypothetical protein
MVARYAVHGRRSRVADHGVVRFVVYYWGHCIGT